MTLVIAVAGGISLAAFAGARRTDSAVGRFVTYFRPAQGQIEAPPRDFSAIARLPEVAATEAGAFMLLAPLDRTRRADRSYEISTVALLDHLRFSRPLVLAGRLPRANEINDVVVNPSAALDGHLNIGSTMQLRAFTPASTQRVLQGSDQVPTGPKVTVRVVGIVRTPSDLSVAPAAPGVVFEGQDEMLFTPGFYSHYHARVADAGVGLSYRLKGDAGLQGFLASVDREFGPVVQVQPGSDDLAAAANAQHATHLEALALMLFGILAALLTLTMVAQAIVRQAYLDAANFPTLRALGMKRTHLAMTGGLRAGFTVVAGALLAVVIAWLCSPTMPIGLARQAEISPGFDADWIVFLLGPLSLIVILTAWATLASWRAAQATIHSSRQTETAGRRAAPWHWLRLSGLPTTSAVGIHMALDSRRGSVPVRTMVLSAVVAIAAVCATVIFGANLDRLASQPHLQGWSWDVSVGNPHSDDVSARAIPLLSRNVDIGGFTAVSLSTSNVVFSGRRGQDADGLFGFSAIKGDVEPPFTQGHAPRTANEIAFGATTLRELGLRVGDRVEVTNGNVHRPLLITGQMVLTPSVVNNQVPLGHGSLMTLGGLRSLGAGAPVNVFLIRFAEGVNHENALATLNREFPGTVLKPILPPDIENLRRVDSLPKLLIALVALVALVTIGHSIVVSVRSRRRDLAVMRTLGFVGRQISSVVAWQLSTIIAIGLVIGVPVGIVTGRWAWTLVTNQLGLPPNPMVPPLLVLVVPVSLIAANAVALIPGRMASRARLSSVLRAE